jgi:predicted anti-sigma-YlaC factor YlaD
VPTAELCETFLSSGTVVKREYIEEERNSAMKTKAYLIVSTMIFALVGLVHLLRFVMGWSAQVGTWSVPLWMSLLAVLVSLSIALWGVTLARRA